MVTWSLLWDLRPPLPTSAFHASLLHLILSQICLRAQRTQYIRKVTQPPVFRSQEWRRGDTQSLEQPTETHPGKAGAGEEGVVGGGADRQGGWGQVCLHGAAAPPAAWSDSAPPPLRGHRKLQVVSANWPALVPQPISSLCLQHGTCW